MTEYYNTFNVEPVKPIVWHEWVGNSFKPVLKMDPRLKEAKDLVRLLSPERAKNYEQWYEVGQCLYAIDTRLLEDFIKFSALDPTKRDSNKIAKVWNIQLIRGGYPRYTLNTLRYFAKIDTL